MIRVLVWGICGFIGNMSGPGVLETCAMVEDFLEFHGVRPYDFDGDEDVDLADFAKFQNGFDGTGFRTLSQHIEPVQEERFANGRVH